MRPRDRGAPHAPYFAALNAELRRNGPMRPCLLIDLDRLDHNLARVTESVCRGGKQLRLVEKSLPCLPLLEYAARRAGTRRLMSFHQPFLNQDAEAFADADLLLGKPLPAGSAARFYAQLRGRFDPTRQLQWLIDTPARLQQYLELARGLGTCLRINIELDIGLHRGGVSELAALDALLNQIAANPQHLQWSGFMGYDPHVVAVPRIIATRQQLLDRALVRYLQFVEHAQQTHSNLCHAGLVFNTAGSPTYRLHEPETLCNELSVGSALLKPADFDLDTLADHLPAVFIATPVLKSTGAIQLPGLDARSKFLAWWNPNRRQTHFIYGGNWMANYVSPAGLQPNALYGRSANQELVNASPAAGLDIDDHVFLRPRISESVLLQFGDVLAVRNGRIEAQWPVFEQRDRGG